MKVERFFGALIFCAAISIFGGTILAQSQMPLPPYGDNPNHVLPEWWEDLRPPQPGPDMHREPRAIKKGLLAPSIDDRIAFTSFLQDGNTGLIRLLPREIYDRETYHTEKKLNIRGGGAYYSFAHLTHAYGYGSDIELDHNKLSVGFAGADYGLMTNIGDAPLEQIIPGDMLTQYVDAYRPPRLMPEARQEYKRLNSPAGVTLGGVIYRKSLPVQENSTYLLRSIAYRNSDVLVAFRVVRKDTDGSVIIAWKLLKRYSVPQFARND